MPWARLSYFMSTSTCYVLMTLPPFLLLMSLDHVPPYVSIYLFIFSLFLRRKTQFLLVFVSKVEVSLLKNKKNKPSGWIVLDATISFGLYKLMTSSGKVLNMVNYVFIILCLKMKNIDYWINPIQWLVLRRDIYNTWLEIGRKSKKDRWDFMTRVRLSEYLINMKFIQRLMECFWNTWN